MRTAALTLLLIGCRSTPTGAPMETHADLVLLDGTIFTNDPARPRARSVAVRGDRISAIDDEARAQIGSKTRVIALGGRAVIPALTDGHAHLYGLGRALEQIDLRGCGSAEDCAARVAAAAKTRPAGEWLLGRGWDQNRFPDQKFPGRAPLDRATPEHPVFVRRVDGHVGWANARALAAAGVTRATRDPEGGRIERDAAGEPTGVFVDHAMELIDKAIPAPSAVERERAILRAQKEALAHGITEVHEMGIDPATVAVYRDLESRGHLNMRIYAYSDTASAPALLAQKPDRSAPARRFTLAGIKLFADGALGSRGAALLAPYSDDAKNSGLVLMAEARMQEVMTRALATGWQIAVHAIGDRANRAVFDAAEKAGARAESVRRFRIEHAQVVALDDIPRFAKLGIVASMQPTHATSDMPWAEARVGRDRLRGAYAWRRILETGARLVAGSDFPVEKVDPISGGIYAAVTRMDERGAPAGGWLPDQKLTLDEAVGAFSAGAAWAAFEEEWRGRAAVGQAADLTVLDKNIAEGAPAALLETHVDLTIVGGRVLFER